MRLILSPDDADFDLLASMLAARLLHPGADLALPRKIREEARVYLTENRGLFSFLDLDSLDTTILEELIILENPRGRPAPELDVLTDKARRIQHYRLPDGGGEGTGQGGGRPLTTHMVEQLKTRNISLTPAQASFLALGIYHKTRCLTEQGLPRDFLALAFLLDQGADLARVLSYVPGAPGLHQPLFFEKVAGNHSIRSIGGYRILFCRGEVADYLEGIGFLVQKLLKAAGAHLALVLFPFGGNNLVTAITLEETALDLEEILAPFGPGGGPLYVSFFREGAPEDIFRDLSDHLYKNLTAGVTARDVMDRYARSIPPDTTFAAAREQLERRGGTTLPVVGEEGFLGTINLQAMDKALRFGYGDRPVQEYMDPQAPRALPETSLDVLLRRLASDQRDLLPVLDRRGRFLGAVTSAGLLQALYRQRHPLLSSPTALLRDYNGHIEKLMEERAPKYLQGLLYMLGKAAADLEFSAHVVGGFVRDLILGIGSEDLDVVVEGNALALARKVKEVLGGKLQENPDFGTARITTARQSIDFTTAREEFYAVAAALPEVERSSLKKDLFRRDFTVNTLAFQINPGHFGRLFDYYGGLKDLENKTLRVLYSLSFVDDPLRILRALRFSARLGFDIDPASRDLIHKAMKSRVLAKVSKERLTRELELAFREKRVVQVIRELSQYGVLEQIFPHLKLKPENYRILGDMEELILLQPAEEREGLHLLPLYIAGLFSGNPSPDLFSRLNHLRLTRRELEIVTEALEKGEAAALILSREGLPPQEVYDIFSTMALETCIYVLARNETARPREYYQRYLRDARHATPAVTGKELLSMGLEPGPLFKEILNRLRAERIKGRIHGIEDEILFIQTHYLPEKGFDQ